MILFELWSLTEAETPLRVLLVPEDDDESTEMKKVYEGDSSEIPYRLAALMEHEVLGVGHSDGHVTYYVRREERDI